MKTTNHLIGTIGSDPRTGTLTDGRPYVGFRLAVNHDYFNSETGAYESGDTSWYDVAAYGAIAQACACSLSKGDPVIVVGRLRVRDWTSGERSGTAVEIIADAIGHNLRFGTGSFSRRSSRRRSSGGEDPASDSGSDTEWGGLSQRPPAGPVPWESEHAQADGASPDQAADSAPVGAGDRSAAPGDPEPALVGADAGSSTDEDAPF